MSLDSPTVEDIVERAKALPRMERVKLLHEIGRIPPKTRCEKHKRFVAAYCEHLNAENAAIEAGFGGARQRGHNLLTAKQYADVQVEVQTLLLEREAKSELKGEYVRQYLLDILELCPTDYFTLGEDGDWVIDPEQFKLLPPNVKRLVEEVEVKFVKGHPQYKIKFISKTAALAMAARFTLPQKFEMGPAGTPWDQLADQSAAALEDPIERKLREYDEKLRGVQGPIQVDATSVAGPVPVQPATGSGTFGISPIERNGSAGGPPAG